MLCLPTHCEGLDLEQQERSHCTCRIYKTSPLSSEKKIESVRNKNCQLYLSELWTHWKDRHTGRKIEREEVCPRYVRQVYCLWPVRRYYYLHVKTWVPTLHQVLSTSHVKTHSGFLFFFFLFFFLRLTNPLRLETYLIFTGTTRDKNA